MRPTGRLHLGNYVGALENWVRLQDEYDSFCFVADWHALTTDYESGTDFRENGIQVVIDYLAAGLDPERTTIFLQSSVPEHAELHLLFSMVTPLDGSNAYLHTRNCRKISITTSTPTDSWGIPYFSRQTS